MNVRDLAAAAKIKGLNLLGTGDFTHPKHLADLKRDLIPQDNGFYLHDSMNYILTSEISLIYSQDGKGRRVHLLLLAPSFDIVDQINDSLLKWGRLDYDGRPIFGRSIPELMDLRKSVSKQIEVIPAHAWTPWYGIFGSMSGFDSIKEAFGEHAADVHALETGLSSDPAMNWRLSALDPYSLVSFSDSHSPSPWRIGREATIFNVDSYKDVLSALKEKDPQRLLATIEVDPAYGKYHWDGHRDCNVSLSPEEAKRLNNVCPACHKPLTIGVEHRIEELADRPVGYQPKNAIPFIKLIPLSEILAAVYQKGLATKVVTLEADKLIKSFGSELNVLMDAPEKALKDVTSERVAAAIVLSRTGRVKVRPGYDGVYGVPEFEGTPPAPEQKKPPQKTLGEY